MTSTELENLVKIGKLKREPPTDDEIKGLMHSAQKRLHDCEIQTLAFESRFDLAYNAAIILPRRDRDRPDPERLAMRFDLFEKANQSRDADRSVSVSVVVAVPADHLAHGHAGGWRGTVARLRAGLSNAGRWKGRSVAAISGDDLVDRAAELVEHRAFVVAAAAAVDETRCAAHETLLAIRPLDDLGVPGAFVHGPSSSMLSATL
jgi:hypothetical protein